MSKKVLITGIGGQDGYFLSKLLLDRGYDIHGVLRARSSSGIGSIANLSSGEQACFTLHEGNVVSRDFIDELIRFGQFDEVYHLAAQSSVARSIQHPRETIENNVLGLTNIATAIRDKSPKTKLLFTGSSEMFGNLTEGAQSEITASQPQSPYGLTKEMGFHLVSSYRRHYGLWAATAILFNHESEFRGDAFVTSKIVQSVVQFEADSATTLSLGNIHVQRDWGYAGDYMEGLVAMMDQDVPDDFVFATGQLHSVKDFVEIAFHHIGVDLDWSGDRLEEVARNREGGATLVRIDERFYRPGDIAGTCGNANKAREKLGWAPKTSLDETIAKMIHHERAKRSSET